MQESSASLGLDNGNESLFSGFMSELDDIGNIIDNSLGNSDFDYILACDLSANLKAMIFRLDNPPLGREEKLTTVDLQAIKTRITNFIDAIWEKFPDALIILTENELHAEILEALKQAEEIYREDAAVLDIEAISVAEISLCLDKIHDLIEKLSDEERLVIGEAELQRIEGRVAALLGKLPEKFLPELKQSTRAAVGLGMSEDEMVAGVARKVGDPNHRKCVEAAGSAFDWETQSNNP
ncbi:MAG: hypothetical protein PHO48_02565 [Candidatus Gracilibacteria bacterium]|nr:hypothetical protein [Candidatus Gracilibacteria bacterium]MDD5179420.1 hypothetical protein [Candidatus Gracilibacteria bacterium]